MANPVSAFWFDSTMNGAPVLTGEIGKRISVIDACLLTGFGSKTLSSLIVSSGIAIGTVSAGHQLTDYIVGLIEGATPSEINGKKRITVVNSTTFTFDATGIADQAATGTITVKVAPVGDWEKVYFGTNKAAYRCTSILSNGRFLRVDDAGITPGGHARVRGYETMSDVDTGSGPFPTEAQQSGGGYWYGSANTTATARKWALYSDSCRFYFISYPSDSYPILNSFGRIISEHAGDVYDDLLDAGISAVSTYGGGLTSFNSSSSRLAMPRAYTGLGTAILPMIWASGKNGGPAYNGFSYPNPGNSKLYAQRVIVGDSADVLRGFLPGVFSPLNSSSGMTDWDIRSDLSGELSGRRARIQIVTSNSVKYAYLFDLTGPWR